MNLTGGMSLSRQLQPGLELFNLLQAIYEDFTDIWNDEFSASMGFKVELNTLKLRAATNDLANKIFSSESLTKPSIFKQVAAITIYSFSYPFLDFKSSDGSPMTHEEAKKVLIDGKKVEDLNREWIPRLLSMVVPELFRFFHIGEDNKCSHPSKAQFKYPSDHFRVDLISWIRGLETANTAPQQSKISKVSNLFRNISSLAIILEAVYYCAELDSGLSRKHSVRRLEGDCISRLDGMGTMDFLCQV